MKLFFDTEFTGLQKNTTLISIGIIDENNRSFYAEFTDYNKEQVNDWIQENVIQNLKFNDTVLKDGNTYLMGSGNTLEMKGDTTAIKNELIRWLDYYEEATLISDVCHYDMMLFIDIFGNAFDLPKHICPVCYEINQDIAHFLDITNTEAFDVNREDLAYGDDDIILDNAVKHNALWDAQVIKDVYNKIR